MDRRRALPGSEHAALGREHATLGSEHAALRSEHAALRSEHAALGSEHAALRSEHATLGSEHAALRSEHAALRSEHALLGSQDTPPGSEDTPRHAWGATCKHVAPIDGRYHTVYRGHMPSERHPGCASMRGACLKRPIALSTPPAMTGAARDGHPDRSRRGPLAVGAGVGRFQVHPAYTILYRGVALHATPDHPANSTGTG